nr:hypothetical protein [Tanacetum cinerariifolium]
TNSGGGTVILQIDEDQGKDVDDQVNLEEKTNEVDQGQAKSDPGRTPESRPLPEHVVMDEDQAGPNPGESQDEPKKPNVEAKVVSMVTVPIYQASSLVPSLSTPVPVTDLLPLKPASSTIQAPIFTATITTTTTTLPPLPQQQSTTESELAARVTSLEKKLSDLEQKNKTLDNTELPKANMKEILHQRMFETGTYKSLLEHVALYEALEASMERAKRDEYLTEKDKSHKRRCDDQDPPHPSPDSDLTWKKSDTRDAPLSFSKQQSDPHAEQPVEDIPMPDTTRDMRTFMHWYCQQTGKTELTQTDLEGQAYEVVKAFYPDVVHLQFQMEECHKMLTNQIDWANTEDYLRYGSKGSGHALSISKMKAARYLDFGLELLVPEHLWINKVCAYDISAFYGISHWWFNRQKFYIDRHIADSRRKIVRTYMRILSIISIKAYSRYGYDYLKEITLRRANY